MHDHLMLEMFKNMTLTMITSTDKSLVITMDDDETFHTLEFQVLDGVLTLVERTAEPV